MTKKRGLGRGLDALIEDRPDLDPSSGRYPEVSISSISPNPWQPRSSLKDKDLKALAASIRDQGVLEPLLVRPKGPDSYELIAGERRWRAAQSAGLANVPVIIRQASQSEILELALIENLHREDLNPIEEAESYSILSEKFNRTHEQIARLSGKDRSTVANLLRLLALPEPVKEDVRQGRLTAGHARTLLSLNDPEQILSARHQVLARNLSVRETEALVKKILRPRSKKIKTKPDSDYFEALSEKFTLAVGSKVRVVPKTKNTGRLEIVFSSRQDLERLMKILGVGPV